jgi:hypothetical protein
MKINHLLRALALVALAALVAVGAGVAATRHSAAAPTSHTAPTVSGDPNVGSTLTANPGTWNGSSPMSFQYQWQVCGNSGQNCHAISGATDKTYTVKAGDEGNTLRAHVIASNADGSNSANSDATPVIKAAAPAATTTTTAVQPAANGCPKTTAGSASVAAADVAAPARLQVTGFASSTGAVTRSTTTLTVKFHVADTCGQAVSGAQVYATAVPYGQFSIPGMQPTDANGDVTLTFNRQGGFPASPHQQLLVMFVRASRAGDPLLAGISTRRLVSLKVNLHG